MIIRRVTGSLLLGALLLGQGCARNAGEPDASAESEGAVADSIATLPVPARAIREPGSLASVRGVPVVGRTGPGDQPFEVARRTPDAPAHLARRIGRRDFELGLRVRRPDLTQYPCTSCHLGEAMAMGVDRVADAHKDVQPVHPEETAAACRTCHAPADVERLVLFSGETVTIDHTYQLCAQCHFPQLESWAGGGHGKRLDGWQGRRVVMGCADCHDPHNPAAEPRTPFPGPVLPATGGGH